MVQLTEITEATQLTEQNLSQSMKFNEKIAESSDEDYSSDDEDYYNEKETFCERISALKYIISPEKMSSIKSSYMVVSSIFSGIFSKGGSLLWVVTTSALLLGVPLSLSILAEQQLIEMEKSFDLQKDANDILTSSDSAVPAGL